MSKKKKRKTREQKKKALINRQKHLEVLNRPATKLQERQVGLTKETPKAIQTMQDTKAINENKFVISNIKRSIVYILVFIAIIFGLYLLELRMHYFSLLSNNIISILTK